MVPFPVFIDPAMAFPTESLLHRRPHPDKGLADWSVEFDGKLSCSHQGLDPMDGYVNNLINKQHVSNKKKKT